MRTTITLEDDTARLLTEAMHRERRSLKDLVNDALRRALAPQVHPPPAPFRVEPHHANLRAGIDGSALNRLADELEDEAVLASAR